MHPLRMFQLACSEMQVRAEQPFGRSRVDSLLPPTRQGPLASPAPPAAMATAHVGVTQAQKGTPAAPGADGPSDPGKPRRLSMTALNLLLRQAASQPSAKNKAITSKHIMQWSKFVSAMQHPRCHASLSWFRKPSASHNVAKDSHPQSVPSSQRSSLLHVHAQEVCALEGKHCTKNCASYRGRVSSPQCTNGRSSCACATCRHAVLQETKQAGQGSF